MGGSVREPYDLGLDGGAVARALDSSILDVDGLMQVVAQEVVHLWRGLGTEAIQLLGGLYQDGLVHKAHGDGHGVALLDLQGAEVDGFFNQSGRGPSLESSQLKPCFVLQRIADAISGLFANSASGDTLVTNMNLCTQERTRGDHNLVGSHQGAVIQEHTFDNFVASARVVQNQVSDLVLPTKLSLDALLC